VGYRSNSIAAKGVKLELYSKLSPLLIEMEERGEDIEEKFVTTMSGSMSMDLFLQEINKYLKFNMDNYQQINILMTKKKRKDIDNRMTDTETEMRMLIDQYVKNEYDLASFGKALWPMLENFNRINYDMRKALKEEIYF